MRFALVGHPAGPLGGRECSGNKACSPMRFTWHVAGIMERRGAAMVQPRENFSSHRDSDAGGRSVAEIQTNWAVHLHRNLITARRVIRRRLVDQPLTPMRRSKGTQVRQLSPRQQSKNTR